MNTWLAAVPIRGLFDWTWHTSLQVTVLIGLVLLVQGLLRKRLPAPTLYALWMLVLIRLLVPVIPASSFSIFNLHKPAPVAAATAPPPASVQAAPPSVEVSTTLSRPGPVAAGSVVATEGPLSLRDLLAVVWALGAMVLLFTACGLQLRLGRRLRKESPVRDPRLLDLLAECRTQLGVKPRVTLTAVSQLRTPAVFGFWRPRLLLPASMLTTLTDRELRMVLLHELVHVRRRDGLWNWLMIGVGAWHWFNPAVWLALKRLRAERELVCDRRVLAVIEGADRQCYGNTLLKLVSSLSRPAWTPGLVPLLSNHRTLKRRITMIANYKPASRMTVAVALGLLVLLAGLTFTRAVEQRSAVSDAKTPSQIPPSTENRSRGIEILQKQIADQDSLIKVVEQRVNMLRDALNLSPRVDPDQAPSITSEEILRLSLAKTDVKTQLLKERSLLEQLKKADRNNLQQILLTVQPDEVLATLMQDQIKTATELTLLSRDHGAEHPAVRDAERRLEDADGRIARRIDGILKGLEIRVRAMEVELDSLDEEIARKKAEDHRSLDSMQAYVREKRNLDNLLRFREALAIKLAQERVDAAVNPAQEKTDAHLPKSTIESADQPKDK